NLDGRASGLELRLDLLSLFLRHAFLDDFVAGLDEILGLLQTEVRDGADFLDDVDLLVASRLQDDGELGLLLSRGRSRGSASHRSDGDSRSSGGNAPLVLEHLGELGSLENGEVGKILYNLSKIGHCVTS